jgi:glycosyltransferase involved in cell wall biosynthesis
MKVALTAEGTYPHQFGGVSVWCDQLIKRMPQHDFTVVPLVATGNEPMRWQLPANVRSVVTIPLWGRPPSIPLRSRLARGRYEALVADLIDVLLSPPTEGLDRFTDVVHELFRYGQRWNLAAALSSETAVRLLAEAWQQRWPEIMPRNEPEATDEDAAGQPAVAAGTADADRAGVSQGPPTLADAVGAMQLIEHGLRPLSYPPVQADVVHAVTNGLGALPAFAAKWQYGTPMMLTEHGVYMREQYLHNRQPRFGWPVKDLYLRFLRRLCALGYRQADVITPGNIYNQRWEIELGADASRIRTVYNGVDPAIFPVVSHEPDVPTISWAGRIDPFKDLETLLRAFSLVIREIPQAQLKIFGSAPPGGEAYLERCQAEAAELGISDQTSFEGRVPEIRDAYAAGHIVVLCSITEGFPYTLIEAMTCGRACVATDVGGVTEAIGDAAGLVVPPRSPAALAEACLRLLRNDELRRTMGAAARARAVEHFTVDRAVDAFDEMYAALAGSADKTVAVALATAMTSTGAPRAGHTDVETGPASGHWNELPAEEEDATVIAPRPDPRPVSAAAVMADDATQVIALPDDWRGGPGSEETLIMPQLHDRSANQADPDRTQIVPRKSLKSDAPSSTELTTQFPALKRDLPAAGAKPAETKPADSKPADSKPAEIKPAGIKRADKEQGGREPAVSEPAASAVPPAATKSAAPARTRAAARKRRRSRARSNPEQTAQFPALKWDVPAAGATSAAEDQAGNGPAASAVPEAATKSDPKRAQAVPPMSWKSGPPGSGQTAQFPAQRQDVPAAHAGSAVKEPAGMDQAGQEPAGREQEGKAPTAGAVPEAAASADPEQTMVMPRGGQKPGAPADAEQTAQLPALKPGVPAVRTRPADRGPGVSGAVPATPMARETSTKAGREAEGRTPALEARTSGDDKEDDEEAASPELTEALT